MIKHLLLISSLSISLSTRLASAQTTIEKVAPENSVVIAGIANVSTMMERLKRTGLWAMWNDEKIKSLREQQFKDMTEQINKTMEELGVDKDSLVPPTGPVGVAVFPLVNPDTGVPAPAMLMLADYGENADKTDVLMQAAITKGEKEGDLEYEKKDINGRTVYSIDMTKMQEKARVAAKAAADAAGEEGGGADIQLDLPPGVPNPVDMVGDIKTIHYVRDGHTLMLSNDMAGITEALDFIDGKGGKTVAERVDYQAIMSRIGDSEMFGVLLTRDLMEMSGGNDQMAMAQMMVPMVRAAVGHVHGYGFGMRLDGPKAMVEQNFTIYMPDGKAGLTTLVDSGTARGTLPPFVNPETVTYSTFNVEFKGLMDVVRKIVDANPILKMQAGEQIDMVDEGMRQLTATLGTEVHFASTITKPLTETSQKSVWAVQCTNPQEFENLFSGWASQIGMESRDFLGQRIFSMKPEMMGMMPVEMSQPMSLGIGGGFVLIGPTTGVEQALRASSQTGVASLSSDANFQKAVATLSADPAVAWGYSLTTDTIEASMKGRKAADMRTIEDIKEFDPDGAADYQKEIEQTYKVLDAFDFDLLRKYMGPSVWQIRATEDGFVGNFYMLSAEPKSGQ